MSAHTRHDLKAAFRNLAQSPGFAAIAIISLAIGIGATTTVFSLMNTVLWKPLPYRDAGRLVDVYVHNPEKVCEGCGVGGSYADYLDWRERARAFSELGAYTDDFAAVDAGDGAIRSSVARLSASTLPLLDVPPVRGRWFGAEEDRVAAASVALISERLWQRRYNSDPAITSRIIRINGQDHAIIGVMPERFTFPMSADVWTPLAPVASPMREQRDIGIVGRLADGRSLEDARVEMSVIGKQLQTEYPAENAGWNAFVAPLRADMADDYVGIMPVLLAAVLFVLLIACANLGSILLARAVARRRELAVRAALGASRALLVRQLITESFLVAAIGGALGLLLASWAINLAQYTVSESWPGWMEFTIDWRVALFAVAISVLTALAFGLLPAVRASRADVHDVLKDTGRSGADGRGGQRLRNALVVVELSLSLVLLACAGMFTQAAVRSSRADPGYDPQRFIRGDVTPPAAAVATELQRITLADDLETRLRSVPGVGIVAFNTLYVRAWPGTPSGTPAIEGAGDTLATSLINHVRNVTPDYFAAYQLRMKSGRAFAAADRAGSDPVAIVSRRFAEIAWPAQSPIGKRIRIGLPGDDPWRTVVGVTDDNAAANARTLVYLPYAQFPQRQPGEFALELLVRTTTDEATVMPLLRDAIKAVDRDASVDGMLPVREHISRMTAGPRNIALLSSSLAAFALLLSAIGVYGVVAFSVSQRKHEIGIRMALGAAAVQVKRMMIAQAMRLAAIGLLIGIPSAFAFALVIRSLIFYGRSSASITVYIAAALFFLLVTAVAAWLPARRAAHVDPLTVLRTE